MIIENYAFATKWPKPKQRWALGAEKIGVYAIVHKHYAYVGMTVSTNGFKARWAKHYRNLFVKKRAIAHKKLKEIVKVHKLLPEDFTLYALQTWETPEAGLTKALTSKVAKAEQIWYDLLSEQGFTLVNTVRPTGAGYVTSTTVSTEPNVLLTTETGIVLSGKDAKGQPWRITGRALPLVVK